jgi:hypothetical protein
MRVLMERPFVIYALCARTSHDQYATPIVQQGDSLRFETGEHPAVQLEEERNQSHRFWLGVLL